MVGQRGFDGLHEVGQLELAGGEVDRDRELGPAAAPFGRLRAGGPQHPFADLHDVPRALGDGDELVGRDRAELGTGPAGERLEADGGPVGEVDERLVDDADLVTLERAADRGTERQQLGRLRAADGREHAADRLVVSHRVVGAREQVCSLGAPRPDGQSEGGGHPDADAVDVERRGGHRSSQPCRQAERLVLVSHVPAHDGEHVAAQPAEHVDVAHLAGQAFAQLAEHLVGGGRAVGLVDQPEFVHPEADRGDGVRGGRPSGVQELVGLRTQELAVGQPRQPVVQALVGQGLAQLQLCDDGGGEVVEYPDVVLAPLAGLHVDRAERSDGVAVGEHQRHARVRDRAEVVDREVVLHERMLARVVDYERLLGGHRVLAEGVAERRLGHAGGQARLALEELPVRRHQ